MAQNYISRGEVITLTAKENYLSGKPYRINGFNGVALLTVKPTETLSFQLEGVFELESKADVIEIGDLIYIWSDGTLHPTNPVPCNVFGRAVTVMSDEGKFYCRLVQSE